MNPRNPTVLATVAALLCPTVLPCQDLADGPRTSPFRAMRQAGDAIEVQVDDATWNEWLDIDGIAADDIRDWLGRNGHPTWKRITEDLPAVLQAMGHDVGKEADLGLRDPETGKVLRMEGVALTAAKRRRLWHANDERDREEPATASLEADAVAADPARLRTLLDTRFAYRHMLGVDLDELMAGARERLRDEGDEVPRRMFAREVARILRAFGDGHARVADGAARPDPGYLPFLLADAELRGHESLWITAPGFQGGELVATDGLRAALGRGDRVHDVHLARSVGQRGRALWSRGSPAAGAPLVVVGRASLHRRIEGELHGHQGAGRVRARRCDGDGRFAMVLADSAPLLLGVPLPGEEHARIARRLGSVPHPLALLWLGTDQPEGGDFGTLSVDRLRAIRLVVRHHDRRPAPRATISLGVRSLRDGRDLPLLRYLTDGGGTLTLLLPATDELVVGAAHEGAGDVFRLAVRPAGDANGVTEMVLDLPEPHIVEGLVTEEGEPLHDVRFTARPFPAPPSPSWSRRPRAPRGDPPVWILRRGHHLAEAAHMEALFSTSFAVSDERGHYRLRIPSPCWHVMVRAVHPAGIGFKSRQMRPPTRHTTELHWAW